jgi:hypothetical protein
MAETYTDSTGKVFPVNAFGRPQGYWDGNKFVFPKFGVQPAAAVPAVDPVTPAPAAPPVQQPGMVVQPPQHEGDSQWEALGPLDRSAANNWGYASNLERGLLSGILPAGMGHAIGSGNNWEAMQMDRTGWSKQFSPSFLDVATGGIFAGPMYDQSVLNIENRNIAGRPGLFGTKSPYMDYTHSYGSAGPVYNPWERGPLHSAHQARLDDLFGINQPGIDPFGAVPSGSGAYFEAYSEDDIGDIDPMSNVDFSGPFSDPFGDIADALAAGDAFGLGEDTMGGDTTADDGVGFDV